MDIKKIDFQVEGSQGQSAPQSDVNQPAPPSTPASPTNGKKKFIVPLFFVLVIILGVATGAMTKKIFAPSGGPNLRGVDIDETSLQVGDTFGVDDTDLFPDTVSGYLQAGGINGEGTHSLLRPGGDTQTVYLTSSIVDLDEFVGHQVTIWGETFSGQKAGWLMDVGRVRIDELNAEAPED